MGCWSSWQRFGWSGASGWPGHDSLAGWVWWNLIQTSVRARLDLFHLRLSHHYSWPRVLERDACLHILWCCYQSNLPIRLVLGCYIYILISLRISGLDDLARTRKTFLDQTDEYTTLREISSVVTVTKSVTIATNPSNKLPLAVTTLIAVEEVNSGPLGFHKSWGSYLDK